MSPIYKIRQRNERDFSLIIIRKEVKELQRERAHLNSKALERKLTVWERTRLDQIFDELASLIEFATRGSAHRA
jgi:hypothetical protein